ncbi:MAG: hypothetical protein M1813_008876 [Trichoglossum hirsutum]|nr:MAG: hypothetical protein M1813_008876 [Trichoglossum hirsutum]
MLEIEIVEVELREMVEVEKVEEKEVKRLEGLREAVELEKEVEDVEGLWEAVEEEGLREVEEVEKWDEDGVDSKESDAEGLSCFCSGKSSGLKSSLNFSFSTSVFMSGTVTDTESEGPPFSKTQVAALKPEKKMCAATEGPPKGSEGKPNDLRLEDGRERKAKKAVSDESFLLRTGTAPAVAVAKKGAIIASSRVGVASVNVERGRMMMGDVVVAGVVLGAVLVPKTAFVPDVELLITLVGLELLEWDVAGLLLVVGRGTGKGNIAVVPPGVVGWIELLVLAPERGRADLLLVVGRGRGKGNIVEVFPDVAGWVELLALAPE